MPIVIEIEGRPLFDQRTQTFLPRAKSRRIRLEHSLISISKWEEETKRKYFSKLEGPKTAEDMLFYIKCMSLDGPIEDNLLRCISQHQLNKVTAYVNASRTATTIIDHGDKNSGEVLTSEIIYYYMAAFRLPSYTEKWHLSRLLTLIRVASDKQSQGSKDKRGSKPNKVNYNDKFNSYASINARNRAILHSKG